MKRPFNEKESLIALEMLGEGRRLLLSGDKITIERLGSKYKNYAGSGYSDAVKKLVDVGILEQEMLREGSQTKVDRRVRRPYYNHSLTRIFFLRLRR